MILSGWTRTGALDADATWRAKSPRLARRASGWKLTRAPNCMTTKRVTLSKSAAMSQERSTFNT
jgi:hypothetical protein